MSNIAADFAAVAAFLSGDKTNVLAAVRARPKVEHRRPKDDVVQVNPAFANGCSQLRLRQRAAHRAANFKEMPNIGLPGTRKNKN